MHGRAAERRALAAKLWQVFWLGGGVLAALSFLLIRSAEQAYFAGYPALEALLNVARLLLYLVWFQAVWRCSRNTGHAGWTHLARGALVAGLAASAVLY